jgi:hypothetical protein
MVAVIILGQINKRVTPDGVMHARKIDCVMWKGCNPLDFVVGAMDHKN